jgi:hypothetical protein
MRVILAFALLAAAQAFAPSSVANRGNTALSSVKSQVARKEIRRVTKDNFSATLDKVEPFLTEAAGSTFYSKAMRRLTVKAQAFGATIPDGYAKEAKATAKRREKQTAFIQAKVEAAAAAAAEAAEKAAAEAAEKEAAEAAEKASAEAGDAASPVDEAEPVAA